MRIAVIYQNIPDDTSTFIIDEEVSEEDMRIIEGAHGQYVNGNVDSNSDAMRIFYLLDGTDIENEELRFVLEIGVKESDIGKFSHCAVDDDHPIVNVDLVVVTGFVS